MSIDPQTGTRSSPSELSEEGRAFLQHRVALVGLILGSISAIFVAWRVTGAVLSGHYTHTLLHPSFPLHVGAMLLLFSMWVTLRNGSKSLKAIQAIDAVGLVGSSWAYIAMGFFIPMVARPDMLLLMILSVSLMARSVYVPSSPRRTAVLGALVGAALLHMVVYHHRHGDTVYAEAFSRYGTPVDPAELSMAIVASAACWFGTIIYLAATASKVIYGLRRRVRKALQLGQYVLVRKIGAGGMGEVCEARHVLLRRPAALKLLQPEKAGEHNIRRFEREVRSTASLTHPNTVTIFDFGRAADGTFYYAMELLEGGSLTEVVAVDGPQEPARVVHIVHQVADALSEAHGKGLIHRDIKPGNVMLTSRGGVPDIAKVVDFGLVKELDTGDASLTGDNTIVGTPLYLAPEAIRHKNGFEPRSDLYALGAVAYFLLTGEHVFDASSTVELLGKHLMEAPQPPSARLGAPLPEDLEALVLQLLEKDVGARPESALELMTRLEALACYGTWSRERARRWWNDFGPEIEAGRDDLSMSELAIAVALEDRSS